jgi:hypothetical protein
MGSGEYATITDSQRLDKIIKLLEKISNDVEKLRINSESPQYVRVMY